MSSSESKPSDDAHWIAMQDCEFQLLDTEVHIWRVSVAEPDKLTPSLHVLSEDEVDRAQRFQRDIIRSRFVGRRAALRQLLGKYLSCAPASIRFEHNKFGKPQVVDDDKTRCIHFSSTSSEDIALIAIANHNEIGCDVEIQSRKIEFLELAERFFHPEETADIRSRSTSEQRSAFFHCWARKEAYVKALGKGLYLPLDSFRVNVGPDQPRLLWADPQVTDIDRWCMRSVDPDADYAGALMTPSRVEQIRLFDFSWY